jgi:hypothetical protein
MSVNVMGDAEPSDTFQNALLPCEGGYGAGSACRETDDVRHFKNLFCLVTVDRSSKLKRDIRHEIATYVKSCWAELLTVLTVLQFDNIRQCVVNEGGHPQIVCLQRVISK